MKIKLFIGKETGIALERTPEEYKLMEQDQLFKQQLKLSKVPMPKGTGDTYTNCTITHREPVIVPQPMMMMQKPQTTVAINPEFIEKATDYTAMHTGQNTDVVSKVIDSLLQYFRDRGII
jgi:hypothetical protein